MKGANGVEVFGASADNWRHNRIHSGCIQESVCTAKANGGIRRFARTYGRIWKVWLIAIIVSISIPTYAFAATGNVLNYNDMAVVWGPNPVGRWGSGDSDDNGVIVVANSMYNAAIVTCGYDVLDSRLTHDVKAKLSNVSTGGNFYIFAQTFECFQGQDGYNYPTWNRSGTGVVDTIASLYGSSNVWWSIYDSYLLQSAKEDLQAILNGEDLGGGSGSGSGGNQPVGDYYVFDVPIACVGENGFSSTNNSFIFYSGNNYYTNDLTSVGDGSAFNRALLAPLTVRVKVPSIVFGEVEDSNGLAIVIHTEYKNNSDHYAVSLQCIKFDNITGLSKETATYNTSYLGINYSYVTNIFNYSGSYTYRNYNGALIQSFDDGVMTLNITYPINRSGTNLNYMQLFSNGMPYNTYIGYLDIEPVIPPTNWPTSPTPTPVEPPEVPEPPTTTPPTQPTPPTSPTPPTYQPQPVYVTSNFTVDLQGVLDAMDEHCQHIQNALYQNSKNLYEDLATYLSDKYADLKLVLDGNFGYIGETIDDGFEDLKSYLWDLFKWLKRNMDFTFTAPEYDDSSVLSWLKKIYSKMGTGIRSKPVDPVVDPVGAWDWLAQLIQGILGALSNAVGGLAGTVGDLFDGIKDKFPFSIPWDLVAILALFDAAPVTPQATIDYTILANGPVSIPVHWDINLHYLDDTMGTIRAMEDIVFCFFLLLKTDWLSNIFDGIGDYLGGKLRTSMRS